MLIDCDTCRMRGAGCADCVISVLLTAPEHVAGSGPGPAPAGLDLDDAERRAVGVLAESGLVPPLRLVPDGISRRESA